MKLVAAEKLGWKKGPWTHEEDKLLSEYVNLHGEGRWSSVSKFTGINRGGKSCRLRWVNYLRPGLKKGHLTSLEEGMIIELHAVLGNKWSTIARYLPGRTDNEIKNYWRTHFGKRPEKSKNKKLERGKAMLLKQLKQEHNQELQQPQDPNQMTKNISSHDVGTKNENKPPETRDKLEEQEMGFKCTTMEQQCTSVPLMQQELSCMWPQTTAADDGVWHCLWDFDEPQGFADHVDQCGKCFMPNQATFGAGGDSMQNQDRTSPFDDAYAAEITCLAELASLLHS